MDTDLYQILTLILLFGLLLTLFGVLQSLGAIRRTLEGGGTPQATPASTAASEPATDTAYEPDEQPATWARPSETETASERTDYGTTSSEPARTGWPAPQEATASAEPAAAAAEPAASSGGGARVLYGDAGLTSATPNESALRPEGGESEAEPAEASTATASASTSTADDPQEQPFERDGRWWFRRGDELLVYEEQTGQWVAAPGEPSTSGSVAAPVATGTATAAEPAVGATEGQVTTQQEAVGSFWKCPSCGAVNGSTATSCRMCFTARP